MKSLFRWVETLEIEWTPFILKILLQFCMTLNEPGRLNYHFWSISEKGFLLAGEPLSVTVMDLVVVN